MIESEHVARRMLPVPGPKGIRALGMIPGMMRNPFGYLMATAARHDGLVRLNVGPFHIYLVSHPDYVRRILVENNLNYYKGSIMDGIRMALGNGLFTADGDLWSRQRRLMVPVFHHSHAVRMVATISALATDLIQSWMPRVERGEPVDMLSELVLFNIDLIQRTLFGATIGATDAQMMFEATQAVFQGMSKRVWAFFVPRGIPVPGQKACQRAIKRLDDVVLRLVDQRRRSKEEYQDLLGLLLSARDEETGEGMSDLQLRDEIFTIFLAGYESTATAVSWALFLLSQHPQVDRKMQQEVDDCLDGRIPTMEDIPRLAYTRMVIDEAMRLYPSFPMYFRTSRAPDQLGPYEIPGDASIVISPYATHHSPEYWDEPERFDPERFAPGRLSTDSKRAYYPFGHGKRICIGRDFALTEATTVLSMIAQRFNRRLVPGTKIEPHYAMSLTSRYGVPLLLQARQSTLTGTPQ
ncbi:MAG: cytochrome P450 [Bryobacteraceae bacterium]